jgi:transcriptional regulator with XRE-family HTH domain
MATQLLSQRRLRAERRDLWRRLGTEIRAMRMDAGRSQASVARAAGVDRAHVSRIESGTAEPSIEALMAVAAALGADLSVRVFPNTGPRIRDHLQIAISEALIAALDPRWRATPEVPVYRPVRGVIDIVLSDTAGPDAVAVEIHSQLRRVEQQVRWATQKADALAALPQHADRRVRRLLVLRNTAATREAGRQASETLRAAYPASSADAVAALRGTAPWPGDVIVWANVTAGRAQLLQRPPRGVAVGR